MIAKKDAAKAYLYLLSAIYSGNLDQRKKIGTLLKDLPDRLKQCIDFENMRLKTEARKLIKIVATGGKFELLHPGHLFVFEQAKKLGDVLVVVAATDKLIEKAKKRKPLLNQKERLSMLNALKVIDIAIPGCADKSITLAKVDPDVIVLGYDQVLTFPEALLKGKEIIRLKKAKNYSSSFLFKRKKTNAF